jgi:hypothetical protein
LDGFAQRIETNLRTVIKDKMVGMTMDQQTLAHLRLATDELLKKIEEQLGGGSSSEGAAK